MPRGGEHLAQDPRHLLRFLGDLLFAEPDDLEPASTQIEIAAPVVAKGLASAVIAIAIGFDGQAAFAPEKVDQIGTDANIDLGARQPLMLTDPQKVPLEVAARAVVPHILSKGQPQHICLSNRLAQLPPWDRSTKIGDRSGRLGDGYSMTPGNAFR